MTALAICSLYDLWVMWSMSSFQSAQCPTLPNVVGATQNYIGFVINAGAVHAPTDTRTGLTLPPVGTIVCIHSTSGLHHHKTTATTTQHRSIMRLTHTLFNLTHFNTSSCAALLEWNTEAQCWTSSSSKQAEFTLFPGNVLHLDLLLERVSI